MRVVSYNLLLLCGQCVKMLCLVWPR